MPLFHSQNRTRSPESERLYARYELMHTLVDFAAAILFLVGSVLFFWKSLKTAAIWLFVLGSLCFCAKPTIRLVREIQLYRMGKFEKLAQGETDT